MATISFDSNEKSSAPDMHAATEKLLTAATTLHNFGRSLVDESMRPLVGVSGCFDPADVLTQLQRLADATT